MALPNVRILIQNGQLGGLVAFAAGVAALMGTGVAVVGKIGIGDPRLIFNLDEAIALGITLADNPVAYRQVKEFYDEAGAGRELYVMLVADTMNQTTMNDLTNANGIVKLLNYANGRIRMYATFFAPAVGYSLVTTAGIDADVYTAIVKAQATNTAYALAQTPVRSLIEGRAFTGVAADLTNLTTMTNNRVGVVIGGSASGATASVGLALGRLAKIPVQRKLSRVKDGGLNILTAYAGATTVEQSTQLGLMHDKGFIVLRTFPGITGYYFSDDRMATAPTDDYRNFSRGRVIDKMAVIAYATYVEELHDEILVNTDGTLNAGQVRFLEAKIENQINQSMTANREISSVKCTIDPTQNILSNPLLEIVLKAIPAGYLEAIDVLLGFDNPNV
jgi:hypothetical protein